MMHAAFFWAMLFLAGDPPEWKGTSLDGTTTSGKITAISPTEITVAAPSGDKKLAMSGLLSVVASKEPTVSSVKPMVWIELIDQSRIPALQFESVKGQVKITGLDNKIISTTVKSIASVHWDEKFNPNLSTGHEAATDQVRVRMKTNAIDTLDGVVEDITKDTVNFKLDGSSIPIKQNKIVSVMYVRRADADPPTPVCVIDDASGGHFEAKAIALAGEQLTLTTLSGLEMKIDLNLVSKLDFSSGKIKYLSDIKPETVTVTPFIDVPKQSTAIQQYYAPRIDRGRDDPLLKVDGKSYSKGISLLSRTEMTFKMPTKFRRFQGIVGIDDSVGDEGNVVFKVIGDGKELFSQSISGREKAIPLDVDISNVRKLTILVDYGEDLDVGDYLDICDARIVK
jgi:hypothetical protein